jgi:hypothetical protein
MLGFSRHRAPRCLTPKRGSALDRYRDAGPARRPGRGPVHRRLLAPGGRHGRAWRPSTRRWPLRCVARSSAVCIGNRGSRRGPCGSSARSTIQRQPPEAELAEAAYREALALVDALDMRPLHHTYAHTWARPRTGPGRRTGHAPTAGLLPPGSGHAVRQNRSAVLAQVGRH